MDSRLRGNDGRGAKINAKRAKNDERWAKIDERVAKINERESITIHKLGLSIGYDQREHFIRLAFDPNANFGVQNMWRLSVGTRF
jgi:hypothetical protein